MVVNLFRLILKKFRILKFLNEGSLFPLVFVKPTLSIMNDTQKQEMITDMLNQVRDRENDFPAISDSRGALYFLSFPGHAQHNSCMNSDGIEEALKGYKGIVLSINDHGNVTVSKRFKNGNSREIASRV